MRRIAVFALLALLIGASVVMAEEAKGKIKKVDASKGILVLEDQKMPFRISRATKITDAKGKTPDDGLADKAFAPGVPVIITYEVKGKAKVVTEVKIDKK